MGAPYSQDLRRKAIEAVESGKPRSQVCEVFSLHRNTLSRWLKQYRETGTYQAKEGYQKGHSHIITDWDKFTAFTQEHGDKTQAEMAQLWDTPISEDTIGRALKHIGFTRKKRPTPTKNAMKPNDKPFSLL